MGGMMMSFRRRGFWRSYWIALRRSGKDRRARVFVFKIAFAFLYFVMYVVIFYLLPLRERGAAGLFGFYGLIFTSGGIAFFMLRRSHRKQDELLHYPLTGLNPREPPAADISPVVRGYLQERAVIIASLLARAASEIHIERHELPSGAEVLTRQIQNAILRRKGLWDKLEPVEAELVSAADGRWSVEQQNNATKWCEQLRLLRWTLGIDAELMPLAHFPKVDFSLTRELLDERLTFPVRTAIRKSWDLRVERDGALQYAARIVAELKGRALITNEAQLDDWADRLRAESLGASKDYLAGSKTIGELSDESLLLLGAIAVARQTYAAYLSDQLNADVPVSFAT
jgi:hypothetical protein